MARPYDLVVARTGEDAERMSEPDTDILHRIQLLVDEEHQLRDSDESHRGRLMQLEEELDQCWDLLRQRRARREFDQDPGESAVRSADTVEHYQQ
jgi:ornithine cyclodeaminase/alanine dehydrogenase-like protein (mu-crystallin family)